MKSRKSQMPETEASCERCNADVTADSEFCPHCGILFEGASDVRCEVDGQNAAAGVCVLCQTLVCRSCGTEVAGRFRCHSHAAVEVAMDFANVYESKVLANVDLVRAVLAQAGFVVIDQYLDPKPGVAAPLKLFVPIPQYCEAASLVEGYRPAEFPSDPKR